MNGVFDHSLAVLAVALFVQCLAAYVGDLLRRRRAAAAEGTMFGATLPAALTLLGLIVGFSFSMAVSRYDQRKNYEAEEANSIGTEYVRADLLPAGTARIRELLVRYTEQRVLFYKVQNADQLTRINAETASLQNSLWSAVIDLTRDQRDSVSALAVAGMNDVLNSQGYAQAAWWNRIPAGGWLLMWLVAVACNLLVGYSEQRNSQIMLLVLPLIVAIAFFLISDIDSPREGIISVQPQNLETVYRSLKAS